MKKSTIRLICYASILGALGIGAISLFNAAQYFKAKYKSSNAQVLDATSKLTALYTTNPDALTNDTDVRAHDKALWYNDIYETFYVINEKNKNAYLATSIPSYLFSTMTLVAFGLILKFEEKAKDKEDNEVAL